MRTYEIRVACDTDEGEQFVAWLNKQGHDAEMSNDTGNHIDGVWTSTDVDADTITNALWDAYCKGV